MIITITMTAIQMLIGFHLLVAQSESICPSEGNTFNRVGYGQ